MSDHVQGEGSQIQPQGRQETTDRPMWYVVHTYSGYENKVKANLEKSVENRGMQDMILEVKVPMEDSIEVKNGKKKTVSRKVYPGYVMIKMFLTDESWYIVRNTRGVTGFVGPGSRPIPLSDAEKAMSVIRGNAAKWNLDANKVGVIGSSAGGHLAASLSTLAADANRPDFAILYYPVISFDNMTTHGGSKKNLLGKDIENKELVDRYSLQKQVDDKTPKTLLLLSDDDQTVPPLNSILYYTALNEHHIPASLYMFPSGGHGWGFRYDFTYYQEVKDLIQKWLTYIKITD